MLAKRDDVEVVGECRDGREAAPTAGATHLMRDSLKRLESVLDPQGSSERPSELPSEDVLRAPQSSSKSHASSSSSSAAGLPTAATCIRSSFRKSAAVPQ